MRNLIKLILPFLLIVLIPCDQLKYDVTVTLKVIPLFAVDEKGNPVFDLKKEDLEILVAGKPVDIAQFERIDFSAEVSKTTEAFLPKRVIFFIFDTVYTSWYGTKRSKKIAEEIVKKSFPGDRFIILSLELSRGLVYVADPEKNRRKLLKTIKKLSLTPARMIFKKYYDRTDVENMLSEKEASPGYLHLANLYEDLKNKRAKEFAFALSQLEYALKTISDPKLIFLFSEGPLQTYFRVEVREGGIDIMKAEFLDNLFYDYLMKIIKAINTGGSVLFTINPGKFKHFQPKDTGDFALRTLAMGSGGRYFEGSKIENIVSEIRRTISAYYEVSFYPEPLSEKFSKIKIRCKRKDVKIYTLRYIQREKPYPKMNSFERRLYVLNIIKGGSWSRMVAKIYKGKYKTLEKTKLKKTVKVKIKVPLHPSFHYRYGQVFVVQIEPKKKKVKFQENRHKFATEEIITVEAKKESKLFFAIVDEETGAAIYNRIKI